MHINGMSSQLFNHITRNGKTDRPFIIAFPLSEDPFKRPENDRVKALRFTASLVAGELSGITAPYCPIAPTLWRCHETDTKPADRRSSLRQFFLSSSSSSSLPPKRTKVCSCFQNMKFSSVTQSYQRYPNSNHLSRYLEKCHIC